MTAPDLDAVFQGLPLNSDLERAGLGRCWRQGSARTWRSW